MSLPDSYQEHILNSPAVCSNCMAVVREERTDYLPASLHTSPVTHETPTAEGRDGKLRVVQSYYGRTKDATTVDHPPSTSPTDSRRVFCACGVDSAFTRLWDEWDIDDVAFTNLLDRFRATVGRLDITADTRALTDHAWSHFADRETVGHAGRLYGTTPSVDTCLGNALETGIQVATDRVTKS